MPVKSPHPALVAAPFLLFAVASGAAAPPTVAAIHTAPHGTARLTGARAASLAALPSGRGASPVDAARPQVAAPGLPDTPAGRRVAAFFEAFNRADEHGLARFFTENLAPEALADRPAPDRARRLIMLRRDTGTVRIRRVDPRPPASLSAIVEGERGQLLRLGFDFAATAPHHLLGILLDEASADDLAGPPPPMTQAEATAAIDKTVSELAAADAFSGVVLAARHGRTLLHKAWGLASREHGVPNRPDTKFNLGSINKIFTQVALAQLLQQGRASLDDALGRHWPDYPNADARTRVTLRHLVEMRSGIGDFFGPAFDAAPKDRFRRNADFLPLFASAPLLFEPGTDSRYSNGGYIVLGEVIARVSGQDYHDYVREHVFARAGMTDTDAYHADAIVPNLAEGYTRRDAGRGLAAGPRIRNLYSRPARGSAAGGGYSTADDLHRFATALLGDRLLEASWTDWILTRVEPTPGKPPASRARGGLGIAGGAHGISAAVEIDRETGWVLIVLANDDPPMANQTAQKVRRLLDAVTP
jgi:CubicO group peptidase (beta-lactamase class C family)